MHNEPCPPRQNHDFDPILMEVYRDIREELRSRRQAELVYTAAAIAAFGAIAWGMASILASAITHPPVLSRSRIFASFFCVGVAIPIIIKIIAEHNKYKTIFLQMAELVNKLNTLYPIRQFLPSAKASGPGFWGSILIVLLGALSAIAFCLCA